MCRTDSNNHSREIMGKNMLAIQQPSQQEWVIDVKSKLQYASRSAEEALWSQHSIYRVPAGFGDPSRSKAYKPQVVSFGPYHHGKPRLKPMEEHKHRALLHFLQRSDKTLDDFMEALEEVVEELMDSYKQLDKAWRHRDKFLKLMIFDGCFMLEIFKTSEDVPIDYAYNDPIFSKHGKLCIMPHIKRDMLMIENQLPLLVLKTLVAVQSGNPKDEEYINQLVMNFFATGSSTSKMGQRLHVLDVVRQSMLPDLVTGGKSTQNKSATKSTTDVIWPATELHDAGIQFKMKETQMLKIEFKGGILTLPQIIVDDATESKFLNLMAFEQFHAGAGTEVSSYVSFMDNIIDTERDVILLNKKKIIKNFVGTDKAIAKLFNGISQDVSFDPDNSLGEVHKKVTAYCNKKWNRWRANLWHTYFRSPWALLSVLAAIFLLGVTVTQFVYSLIDFYHSKA
ncbi:UPF0481 protein At3g47200-like [Magnolia sinica]|uniref:UPF0481 protein At3g47200-like n=1 Tax=Magnolia sinica TaxID=86752 RepID=UPI0026585721|nr:UPF0481 protein At3g47200-like [Magnolia sinica]